MSYVQRFFDYSSGSYFLFGPRGTGKSTWLRDGEAERNYYTRPERLREFMQAHAEQRTIVIDEICSSPPGCPCSGEGLSAPSSHILNS